MCYLCCYLKSIILLRYWAVITSDIGIGLRGIHTDGIYKSKTTFKAIILVTIIVNSTTDIHLTET